MIKVGCCGFPTSMKKYFENFNLVELNSTFYQYPRTETVQGWREKAPKNFEFTVKTHQDVSHKSKMKVEEVSLKAFEQMKQICKILNSKILLIQTPGSFGPDRLTDAEQFFKRVNHGNVVLVWETRGPAWEKTETHKRLGQVLEALNVTHVTDPFKVMPAYTGEISYFRLHGLGKQMYYYQYSDGELRKLKELIAAYEDKDTYVLFNNLSMFEDAMRFMNYLSKGSFPTITGSVGLASAREIAQKVRYPISRSMLIKRVGWRLVELEDGRQVRFETVLANLPSTTYQNVEELLGHVRY